MAKTTSADAPPARSIADLVADPANRRSHDARNLGMITDSLRAVGASRSIVIDEDDVILAGNGVTQAAVNAGITRVRVIETDGDELIAVRRRGLTDEQKRALAIFDNRTNELSSWNLSQLLTDREEGLSLQPFWTPEEEAAMLAMGGAAGGNEATGGGAGSLVARFGVPPFSVLDARQGYWQDRKRAWLALGIASELGRGEAALPGGSEMSGTVKAIKPVGKSGRVSPGGSPRPAMRTQGGKTVRGDGRGRKLAPAG